MQANAIVGMDTAIVIKIEFYWSPCGIRQYAGQLAAVAKTAVTTSSFTAILSGECTILV